VVQLAVETRVVDSTDIGLTQTANEPVHSTLRATIVDWQARSGILVCKALSVVKRDKCLEPWTARSLVECLYVLAAMVAKQEPRERRPKIAHSHVCSTAEVNDFEKPPDAFSDCWA
jgi:hypothetical protein